MEIKKQIDSVLKKHEQKYIQRLKSVLPSTYVSSSNQNPQQQLLRSLKKLCRTNNIDEGTQQFFRQFCIDKQQWKNKANSDQKYQFILEHMDKNISQGVRKVGTQIDNYISSSKKQQYSKQITQKRRDNFDWLKLHNKYPTWQPKLKAKLVQAISDTKNQARIRERINKGTGEKIQLMDESVDLDQYQKFKIDYTWQEEDEDLFMKNIEALKLQFNSTQFLKRCGRFRFISQHQLHTLASEEISRKLDQTNKVYLSRQFLLDKYYSTGDSLTEQQMRFILKTSPMLSKHVDKNFIRAALKNISYDDINKIELQIAQGIISRFQQVRNTVSNSRKQYQLKNAMQVKKQILFYQRKQQQQARRSQAQSLLKKHKATRTPKASISRHFSSKHQRPLNNYHPASSLFVKDCNQQASQVTFNQYEKQYMDQRVINKSESMISMKSFYSGGCRQMTQNISQEHIDTICQLIKSNYYQKHIFEALNNMEIMNKTESTHRTQNLLLQSNMDEKRTKTYRNDDKQDQTNEALIKRKIIQNRQRAQGVVHVNKMLTLAAQNSYSAFRGLQATFSIEQINTKDRKRNTALYYASKHKNIQFIKNLLTLGADPSIVCQNGNTPLHFIFKTNNFQLITRCLTAPKTPNLNALNSQKKTPLAYCTHSVLAALGLQNGVVAVEDQKTNFDNNLLLEGGRGLVEQAVTAKMSRASIRLKITH